MGCVHSVDVYDSRKSLQSARFSPEPKKQPENNELAGPVCSIGSALLIQRWYRRCTARLEMRRRCAWMIYQSLEYAGEQNHVKLHNLYHDLISNADASNAMLIESSTTDGKGDSFTFKQTHTHGQKNGPVRGGKGDIWQGNWVPQVPRNYTGPVLTLPLDLGQVVTVMNALADNQRLHVYYVFQILSEAKTLLAARPNIQRASTSISRQITVVGDLHGQYADLRNIIRKNGMPDVRNPYIFNGDFVDRGRYSVETLLVILMLTLLRPTAVFINRGNHEDHVVNCQYGFIKEIQKKYKSIAGPLVKCFSNLYRYMPLATVIDDNIFVCHGGVSEQTDMKILETMNRSSFFTLIKPTDKHAANANDKKQLQDLLWSDPCPQSGSRKNEFRGMGCSFGPDVSEALLTKNNWYLLIRSHECKPEGFEWTHDKRVLTVFSASNYYTEGSNKGAYAKIEAGGNVIPIQFTVQGGKRTAAQRRHSQCDLIRSAEESALTDLKMKISAHENELREKFYAADPNRTGVIPLATWSEIMDKVLQLKLPWRTLQPRLAVSRENYMVEYETTFLQIQVSHDLASAPVSVTEELYKNRDTLEGIFRAMDTDNSGHISLEEFKNACMCLPNRSNLDDESITDLAKSIDINKDGQIDFNEFIEAFRIVEMEVEREEQGNDE
ncbi:hypothetical protein EG68_01956 [Paragonimus skrjabini miyazakii]|uniref:Serine/threonine-protein phosphatase with EF-hands n=1 Tax=Paragonimus skrjabini miyazakii TaxID=59628 RepID=A0A8S9Z0H5_9TREM|nr:hypothetical protein EG68_01956 [Paragonimus skrjabini miyazakii]